MATQSAKAIERTEQKALVLSKATLRAAEHLGVSQNVLAEIVGLSPASISRLKVKPVLLLGSRKAYELAALFVRLFRSLDAMTGADDESSRSWLQSENTVLRGRPIDLIQSARGLIQVGMYVDTRRAKI